MPAYFSKTALWFDRAPIVAEIAEMWKAFDVGDRDRFALTHPGETDQDVHRDSVSKRDWPVGGKMSDFQHFNRQFWDGPTHRMYQALKKFDPTVSRVRVTRLKPKRCYSLHNDEEIRYHFVVTTNSACLFVMSEHPRNDKNMPVYPKGEFELPEMHTYRVPADGHIYAFDSNHVHTAINGGFEDRIHILIDTVTPLNDRPMHV